MRDYKKAIRKQKRKRTQAFLATKMGISTSYLSQILNGKRRCPKKHEKTIKKFINQ